MNEAPDEHADGKGNGAAPASRWGVGPTVALVTLAWGAAAWAAHFLWYPALAVTGTWRTVLAAVGGAMMLVGVPLYVWSLRLFNRAWQEGRLATTGPYARCRHPIYATWIFLITPGACLLLGSWVVLTTPVAMYAAARLLVGREERALEARFGQTWRAYRARTGRFWPR